MASNPPAPDAEPKIEIGVAKLEEYGAKVRPVYGDRCPVMYHLFETEMQTISSMNNQALFYFSTGSFFITIVFSIIVGYAYASPPLSELGNFLLYKGTWFTGIISLALFVAGGCCLRSKNSLIEQIKRETTVKPPHN